MCLPKSVPLIPCRALRFHLDRQDATEGVSQGATSLDNSSADAAGTHAKLPQCLLSRPRLAAIRNVSRKAHITQQASTDFGESLCIYGVPMHLRRVRQLPTAQRAPQLRPPPKNLGRPAKSTPLWLHDMCRASSGIELTEASKTEFITSAPPVLNLPAESCARCVFASSPRASAIASTSAYALHTHSCQFSLARHTTPTRKLQKET